MDARDGEPPSNLERPSKIHWLRQLHVDVSPLRSSRDFRFLFTGRTVTLLGSRATELALLFQVKELTGSPFAVGLLGVAELVPVLFFGLYGGLLADRFDRRTIARVTEGGLCLVAMGLTLNAVLPRPMLWPLYAGAAAIVALAALQRPSLDAAVPRIVRRDQLTAASALISLSSNGSFIVGAALGGFVVAGMGSAFAYALDASTFALSFVLLLGIRTLEREPGGDLEGHVSGMRGLAAGVRYARRRQELVGSYLLDVAAMVFAFPTALFPFMAAELHVEGAIGLMFSAMAVGAVLASVTSGWTGRIRRHGIAIAIAAGCWGLAIAGFGLAPNVVVALVCLTVAGAADMLSGAFRDTLWNQTIPDAMRGRLAGIEVVSYSFGPAAGQVRAGAMASLFGTRFSLWFGGIMCVGAVVGLSLLLPRLRTYKADLAQ